MKVKGKKTFLASLLAIVICFAMLIGTTFAWFSDTAVSSGNKISAGTLKVDLELLDNDGNWNSIKDSNASIFNYDKWEPGYTDVKILKVENEGSLALKWKAKIVAPNQVSELADVIEVYVLAYGVLDDASSVAYPADRSLAGYTMVGTLGQFINSIEETTWGELMPESSAYLAIALKMKDDAGNEYQGKDLCGEFDIMIVATQFAAEEDAFDSTYDANLAF